MVSDTSLSSTEGSGSPAPAPLKLYSEKFKELFPYYLAIGMTEEQYWDRDCTLAADYRKADELRRDRLNQEAWLQGAYFYEALARISPILHAFAKKGTKPQPYLEQPLSLTEEQERRKQEEQEKKIYNKGLALMQGFMAQNNKRFTTEGK